MKKSCEPYSAGRILGSMVRLTDWPTTLKNTCPLFSPHSKHLNVISLRPQRFNRFATKLLKRIGENTIGVKRRLGFTVLSKRTPGLIRSTQTSQSADWRSRKNNQLVRSWSHTYESAHKIYEEAGRRNGKSRGCIASEWCLRPPEL